MLCAKSHFLKMATLFYCKWTKQESIIICCIEEGGDYTYVYLKWWTIMQYSQERRNNTELRQISKGTRAELLWLTTTIFCADFFCLFLISVSPYMICFLSLSSFLFFQKLHSWSRQSIFVGVAKKCTCYCIDHHKYIKVPDASYNSPQRKKVVSAASSTLCCSIDASVFSVIF